MEDAMLNQVQAMDKLMLVLGRKKLRRYYNMEGLRKKVPALRLWEPEQLTSDLDTLAGAHNVSRDEVSYPILRELRNGEHLYKFNPDNYKRAKLIKKIVYDFKTDAEHKSIRIERVEQVQKLYWWQIRLFSFVTGTLFGALVTVLIDVAKDRWREKQQTKSRIENTSKTVSPIKSTKP